MTITCPRCGRRLATTVPDKQYEVTIHCACGHSVTVEVGAPRGCAEFGPTEFKRDRQP